MTARDYTTAGLLEAIRAEGSIPQEDPNATDAKLLSLADRVMDRFFVPAVRIAIADFYVTHQDQDVEAGVSEYTIPHRAVTNSVRSVVYVDSSGNQFPLAPVALTDRYKFGTATGVPSRYTIRDHAVVVMPIPANTTGTLRIVYEYRPNALVLMTRAAVITGITELSALSYQVSTTGDFDPTDPTDCDVIAGRAPFSVLAFDAEFDGSVPIIGAGLEFSSVPVILPQAGDYICQLGETVVPQLPAELHSSLALVCAGWYLKATSPDEAQELLAEGKEALKMVQQTLASRQKGEQKKIKPSQSMLRRGFSGGGGFNDWRP